MASRERISVALCTYNGERYLEQQLDSLSGQTELPNELVVYDDGSRDSTLEIVSRWRSTAPFDVQILSHQRNLGVAGAFERAIAGCTGDLVFTCDQDDVWLPHKIQQMLGKFSQRTKVMAVACNARPTNAILEPLPLDLWSSLGLNPYELCSLSPIQILEKLIVPGNFVSGMSLAFRRTWAEFFWPTPSRWLHDEWLAIAAAAQDSLVLDGGELVLYRQHAQNVLGVPTFESLSFIKEVLTLDIEAFPALAARLQTVLSRFGGDLDASRRDRLSQLENHYRLRSRLDSSMLGRLPSVFRATLGGAYSSNALGVATALADLCRPIRERSAPKTT